MIALFLGYNAYRGYRNAVILDERPDYVLQADYGMSIRRSSQILEQVEATLGDTKRIETYVAAENIFLAVDDLIEGKSPILTNLYLGADSMNLFELKEDSRGYLTHAYGIDTDGVMMQRLLAAVQEGTVDLERLSTGEECIVLVPMFLDGEAGQELSFKETNRFFYQEDHGVQVGDTLNLYAENQYMTGDALVERLNKVSSRVAAVIRYFPKDGGIWPFSSASKGYTIIGGRRLVTALYPQASTFMTAEQTKRHRVMMKLFYPYCFGKTYWNVYAADTAERQTTDIAMINTSRVAGLELYNYRTANAALQEEALHNTLLIVLLGLSVALIVTVILSNTITSAIDQERKRFGILQSMGIDNRSLYMSQGMMGMLYGLGGVVAANLIQGIVMLMLSGGDGINSLGMLWRNMWQSTLWMYPWASHIAICVGFVV